MSHEEALRILREGAGTQFDEDVVRVFTGLSDMERFNKKRDSEVEKEIRSLAAVLLVDNPESVAADYQ